METLEISPRQYHALRFDRSQLPNLEKCGWLSASILSDFRDPLKFVLGKEKEVSDAMNWGSLVDCLWTTPEFFHEEYAVTPPDAPQRPTEAMLNAAKPSQSSIDRQRWWASFEKHCENKTVIASSMEEEARAAVNMLNQHPLAAAIHQASKKQVALAGSNPVGPGKAKCLIDLLPIDGEWSDSIPDLKTTNDASPYATSQTVLKFDYVAKLAWYCMMAEAAGYGERKRGIIIWQNSSYPYDVHVREIEKRYIDIGRVAIMKRIERMQKTSRSNLVDLMDTNLSTQILSAWAEELIIGP